MRPSVGLSLPTPILFLPLRVYAYPTYESPREQCSPIRPITSAERRRGEKEIVEESTGVERYADTSRGGPPLSPRHDPRQRPEAFDGESDESRLCEIEGRVSLGIAIYGDSRVISPVWRPIRPNDYYDLRISSRLITCVLLEITEDMIIKVVHPF